MLKSLERFSGCMYHCTLEKQKHLTRLQNVHLDLPYPPLLILVPLLRGMAQHRGVNDSEQGWFIPAAVSPGGY